MGQIELFDAVDGGHIATPGGGCAKTRTRARGWALEEHVCRHCFGRLLSTRLSTGASLYRCTNCGAEAEGHHADVLCACGLRVKDTQAPDAPLVDAGLRCIPNPAPSARFPAQIVAAEART